MYMGLSRSYFGGADEMPTFIDEEGRGGCSSLSIVCFLYCKCFARFKITDISLFVLLLRRDGSVCGSEAGETKAGDCWRAPS